MAYIDDILNKDEQKLAEADSRNGWQIRIAIDSREIDYHKPENQIKIEKIKKILHDICVNYNVTPKRYKLANDEDARQHNSVAYTNGSDRTQLGKEFSIYIADHDRNPHTPEKYKKMMLDIWRELHEANIDLIYQSSRDDGNFGGEAGILSPFSIGSNTSGYNNDKGEGEWNNPDGILFKEFNPYDPNHPILQVEFTAEDLESVNIPINYERIKTKHDEKTNELLESSLENIREEIAEISTIDTEFVLLLNEKGDLVRKDLIEKFLKYQTEFKSAENKGELQTNFKDTMEQDPTYRRLVKDYPQAKNYRGDFDPSMPPLMSLKDYSQAKFEGLFFDLMNNYENNVQSIIADFARHGQEQENGKAPIQWDKYFENGDYTTLINKNPHGMHLLYNRIVMREHAEQAHTQWCKSWESSEEKYTIQQAIQTDIQEAIQKVILKEIKDKTAPDTKQIIAKNYVEYVDNLDNLEDAKNLIVWIEGASSEEKIINESIKMLHDRQSTFSGRGHQWRGKDCSQTWERMMQLLQNKIALLHVQKNPEAKLAPIVENFMEHYTKKIKLKATNASKYHTLFYQSKQPKGKDAAIKELKKEITKQSTNLKK